MNGSRGKSEKGNKWQSERVLEEMDCGKVNS
jgi:hypothetical protein